MKIYATIFLSAIAAVCSANEAAVQGEENACRSCKPEAAQLSEKPAALPEQTAPTEQSPQISEQPAAQEEELSPKQALTKFLRELFDAKTDEEQSEIWEKYKKYRKEFPRTITAKDKNSGEVMRLVNEGETFDCGSLEELPLKLVVPERKTLISEIPNSYELRYRFDADKDGELSDSEMFKLLIELHYILQKANSSYEREMLIERYANAITSQENAGEFSISWGKSSTFKIAKGKDGRWTAPDEEPVKRYKIGEHPSQAKFQEMLADKKFRAAAMKILSRTNPFLRAEKIEEILNDAQEGKTFSAGETLAKTPLFTSFYEYINEKSELVSIPMFKTDPVGTIQKLNEFSNKNMSHFTSGESAEYRDYIRQKNQKEEILF
ncbi:MAG: hypothetical protein IKO42_02290 [Opitutales bacterium]|nr:hypothetical protein [Opitutales bacterium]